jgi:hypothetical protein
MKYVVVKSNDEVVGGTVTSSAPEIAQRFAEVALESGTTGLIPGVYRLVPVDLRKAGPRALRQVHAQLQLVNWVANLESAERLGSGPVKIEIHWPESTIVVWQQENDHNHDRWRHVVTRREKATSRQQLRKRATQLEQVFVQLNYAVE